MKDYFLRASSYEQINQALINAGLLTQVDGDLIASPEIKILDYIGKIPEETGRIIKDKDGNEHPEFVLSVDYHVNLRVTLTPNQELLLPIIPWPKNPYRIPAGGLLT